MELLGFARSQDVHSLHKRDPTFPEPVARIGGGPAKRRQWLVWYLPDVAAWAKRNGFKLGSPPPRGRTPKGNPHEEELVQMREELAELAQLRERLGELSQLRERLEALEGAGQPDGDEETSAAQG